MKRTHIVLALAASLLAVLAVSVPASAHQPWFEEQDLTAASPWKVKDPTVSTVVYATLESAGDVDYFTFDGKKGQRILLEMTIPQIAGQEEFAPTIALLGPGLGMKSLPARVIKPLGAGVLLAPPPGGEPSTFFEPFSRTRYWERQSQRVTLPQSGKYVVAVWHPDGAPGRYGFVIGDKERLGGDPAFPLKLKRYWTPVGAAGS